MFEKNKIVHIDVYPTPIRIELTKELNLLKKNKHEIIFLLNNGIIDGRKWVFKNINLIKSNLFIFYKFIFFKLEKDKKNLYIFEADLKVIVSLVLNVYIFCRGMKYILIIGHVKSNKVNLKEKFRFWGTFLLARKSSAIVYYSLLSYNFLVKKSGITNTSIISYGTPGVELIKSEKIRKSREEKIKLGYVGAINERKNLNVITDYIKNNNNIDFTIIGGDINSEVMHGNSCIRYLKYIEDKDLLEKSVLDFNYGICPSLVEPWGHVVLEMLSIGIPVFVSKYAGSADAVSRVDENLIFDPNNKNDINRIFSYMKKIDEDLVFYNKLSKKSKEVSSDYTIKKMAFNIDKLISELK